ncbi:hypothetical protein [Aureimonas pseudogalii]|uniref:Uncharacterized protein n=1 Tax=Aureimonas pseudogalii TaxID=1744844 RepID=A0A7W6MLZ0_9HYPH|nr:hypothetical protein [Aureimonas pseudogalii]MBB4000303.1 hypothetical protein [Aureimonas pseudogalii]
MIIPRDLNTHFETHDLSYHGVIVGKVWSQYEVKRYIDTRNLVASDGYIVECVFRVTIQPEFEFSLTPSTSSNYDRYPAIIKTSSRLNGCLTAFNTTLVDYSPKTLNVSVDINQTKNISSGIEVTRQHTSSHGNSKSTELGGSISGGYQITPMAVVTLEGRHSWGSDHSKSDLSGNSKQSGTQFSSAASMSIKDWGCYASLDATSMYPIWVWGQEYPWNIVQYKNCNEIGELVLPPTIISLLADDSNIHPPSDLSLFGIDFTSTATWTLRKKVFDRAGDTISIRHDIDYTVASHGLRDHLDGQTKEDGSKKFYATMDNYGPLECVSSPLDLAKLALEPLSTRSAVVGFRKPRPCSVNENKSNGRIISDTNDLLVETIGFSSTYECLLEGDEHAKIALFFKLSDSRPSLGFQIKHWIGGKTACVMSIKVNDYKLSDRFITTQYQSEGEDNILLITLRHQDFSSSNYCDFINLGLNKVEIMLKSISGEACSYMVDAIGFS